MKLEEDSIDFIIFIALGLYVSFKTFLIVKKQKIGHIYQLRKGKIGHIYSLRRLENNGCKN
jgi:hypothetical protein